MLIPFSIYFILFGFCLMFFTLISSDTEELRPEDAERMDFLHTVCVEYITPYYALGCLVLIPTVIICA